MTSLDIREKNVLSSPMRNNRKTFTWWYTDGLRHLTGKASLSEISSFFLYRVQIFWQIGFFREELDFWRWFWLIEQKRTDAEKWRSLSEWALQFYPKSVFNFLANLRKIVFVNMGFPVKVYQPPVYFISLDPCLDPSKFVKGPMRVLRTHCCIFNRS